MTWFLQQFLKSNINYIQPHSKPLSLRPLPPKRNILVAHLSPIPTLRCAAINRLIDFWHKPIKFQIQTLRFVSTPLLHSHPLAVTCNFLPYVLHSLPSTGGHITACWHRFHRNGKMLSSLWLHSEDTTGAGMPVPAIKTYIDFSLQDFMREVIERKEEKEK